MLIDSRYEVLEKLGASVWSTVYKVRDTRKGDIYALKLYQNLDSKTLYEKFSAEEMFIITKTQHPNLLKVHNFGHFSGHIYSLNEFYDGKTLSDFKFSANNPDDLYRMIIQICYGLNELHRRGIVHKDIKPDNIMYRIEEGELKVKILDYGFSKIDLEKSQQHITGTLPYISPEIFRGKPATVESDFYSLGVTLYKIITGALPYSLEQLSDIVTGTKTSVFPKFPSEFNQAISPKLDKLILKMMEKNAEERFKDSYSIASYINRMQTKQYKFSWKFSLINQIQNSSYLIREDYTHQLLGYLPFIEKKNGKVIVITGEEGSGKSSILNLFRYHLLSDEYYLFDYTCTSTNRHPFFALIKEFLSSVTNKKEISKGLKTVSDQFKKYLDEKAQSSTAATDKTDTGSTVVPDEQGTRMGSKELELDYSFAEKVLETLANEKPLIFVIEVGHYLTAETIGFINFISKMIKKSRVMIVLSLDNLGLTTCSSGLLMTDSAKRVNAKLNEWSAETAISCGAGGLIHTIHIPIMPLSDKATNEYVKNLLGVAPPQHFSEQLNLRSNGNPLYIREVLVDLIKKKLLLKKGTKDQGFDNPDVQMEAFNFSFAWNEYELPRYILHNIYNKLSHLSENSYKALHYLAISHTPLSSELIQYLLNADKKSLFFLIQDCINNHILVRKEEGYFFAYQEAKERLFNESDNNTKTEISRKILDFFDTRNITRETICEGLIRNAEIAGDKVRLRRYLLLLAQLHTAAGNRENSFELICRVIALDYSGEIPVIKEGSMVAAAKEVQDKKRIKKSLQEQQSSEGISEKDILKDLALFQETAELTGKINAALKVFNSIPAMPEIFEKYFIRGILNNASENFSSGVQDLETALQKVITGKQRINTLINLVWSYINLRDAEKAQFYLDILDRLQMTVDVKVAYIDRKAVFLYNDGRTLEALQLMEDFKKELTPIESPGYYAKTGSFYNNLALFYSSRKSYDEAQLYFTTAKNIWEQINYKRSLGMSYNNLGDLALRQGNTAEALDYFSKALAICKPIENLKCEVLTNLNFGEAYIKLGKYSVAEDYLQKACSVMKDNKDNPFYPSIIQNLAIVKHKNATLSDYYSFIEKETPAVAAGKITEINPLVKTYIQFLLDIGDYERINRIFIKNTNLDSGDGKEDEFYHQIIGLMLIQQHKYEEALAHLHLAITYADNNRSNYAKSIIGCKIAGCHILMNNIEKAKEAAEAAEKIIRTNRYAYWLLELKLIKIRINLLDKSVNLRLVLRDLLSLLQQTTNQHHHLLTIDIYYHLTAIYRELKNKKRENHYRNLYFETTELNSKDLPNEMYKNYKANVNVVYDGVHHTYFPVTGKDGKRFERATIAKREDLSFEPWQEHLYELLKLDETERLKFFIKKMLIKMFAPNYFSLYLTEDELKEHLPFISYRFNDTIGKNDKNIKEAIRTNEIVTSVVNECNTLYIPLRFKSIVVGCLMIGDAGELPFTKRELILAKELRLHLTSLLVRIRDITNIEKNTSQMKQLMTSVNEIFSLKDVEAIEQEMVSFALDFTGCTRSFLIKKDSFDTFVYQIAMDNQKNILNEYSQISKTVLSEVFNREQHIHTLNAMYDSTLKNSISVQDYRLHSIYCAPVVIEKRIHALLYLDNVGDNKVELQINNDLMEIFLLQMSIALKNAKQYASLMKKNRELHYLDTAKTEFMSIISHELNTPLTTLQNYVSQLKDQHLKDPQEREKLFKSVESSLARIMDKVNDIFSFTKYSLLASIQKAKVDVKSLLEIIVSEAELLSKSRKMIFRLEVKENLPPIEANWESLYLMIFQIVLNSIRFTKDFGTINIGARKSSFQDEEIENKESLVIYVQDNGMGIPSKDLDSIFTPFKELKDLYSHQSGTIEFRSSGLGLGLSTAKRIVELHSGRIIVKSKEGEGTTVFIILPFSGTERESL